MAGPGIHQFQNLTMQQVLAPQLQQSLQILQAADAWELLQYRSTGASDQSGA